MMNLGIAGIMPLFCGESSILRMASAFPGMEMKTGLALGASIWYSSGRAGLIKIKVADEIVQGECL